MSHSLKTLSGSVIAAGNMTYQGRRAQTAIAKEPSQIRALQVLMLASALLVLPATFVVPSQLRAADGQHSRVGIGWHGLRNCMEHECR